MRYILVVATLAMSACTASQVGTAVADGQLVCARGPTVVAMAYPSGAAILAKGAPKAFVDTVCAGVGGIAVSPPAPGTAVPTVTIALPAFTVPLKS